MNTELSTDIQTLVVDTGNIVKCKELTQQVFQTLTDELVASVRHALHCLCHNNKNQSTDAKGKVEYVHEKHETCIPTSERELVKVSLKIYLTRFDEQELRDGVLKTLAHLGLNHVESLVVSFPFTNNKLQLSDMQTLWTVCEELVREGKVKLVGVADFDINQLKELYEWAQVKPSINQVNLEKFVVPKDLSEFAKENSIQLLSHSDPAVVLDPSMMSRVMDGYSQYRWKSNWCVRYSVLYKCRGVLQSKGYILKMKRVPASP